MNEIIRRYLCAMKSPHLLQKCIILATLIVAANVVYSVYLISQNSYNLIRITRLNHVEKKSGLATKLKGVVSKTLSSLWKSDIAKIEVSSLDEANVLMENISIEALERKGYIQINYPSFKLKYPNFISDKDRRLFLKSEQIQRELESVDRKILTGKIAVVRDGTFVLPHECGWNSDINYIKQAREVHEHHKFLIPLIVPDDWSFQHFMDGTLPKIVQVYELLKRPSVKVLLVGSKDNRVRLGLLDRLGIALDKVVWYVEGRTYGADYMIYTCVTPPLHPELWNKARQLFRVHEDLQINWDQAYVLLMKRTGIATHGRFMKNYDLVYRYLKNKYGKQLIVFESQQSFASIINMMGKVKIVIGPHGGAFYNIQFATRQTVVIEMCPVLTGGVDIHVDGGKWPTFIIWRIADLMNLSYWRVPIVTNDYPFNMDIDISKVSQILNKVDVEPS